MTISFALFCIILGIGAANAHGHGRNTTQCNSCLADDFVLCANNSVIQNCMSPATDSCYSVAGRYKLTSDPKVVRDGVARGCGSCPNMTEGCKVFKRFFDARGVGILLDCNMVCCRGDRCNNQTVSLLPSATPPTTTGTTPRTEPTTDEPTAAGHPSHYSPTTGVLAIAAIIGGFLLLI